MAISKVSGVDYTAIAKVNGVAKASIANINGVVAGGGGGDPGPDLDLNFLTATIGSDGAPIAD